MQVCIIVKASVEDETESVFLSMYNMCHQVYVHVLLCLYSLPHPGRTKKQGSMLHLAHLHHHSLRALTLLFHVEMRSEPSVCFPQISIHTHANAYTALSFPLSSPSNISLPLLTLPLPPPFFLPPFLPPSLLSSLPLPLSFSLSEML